MNQRQDQQRDMSLQACLPPWANPPERVSIGQHEVHVWRCALRAGAETVNSLEKTLSPDEVSRAERFRFPADRHRFIVARGALRRILASYRGQQPDRLRFGHGPRGKPFLEDAGGLEFNVSRSRGLALVAVSSNRAVGVDLEFVRTDFDYCSLIDETLTRVEAQELLALPRAARNGAFFVRWSRKEAFLKATGKGLSIALQTFSVSQTDNGFLAPAGRTLDPGESSRWRVEDIEPARGFVGCLAAERQDWKVQNWQWGFFP